MTRARLLMLGLAVAMVAVIAAPAGAQDAPTLTVEPSSVDAAGETEFTVTGEGWTATPPIFVLPCVDATTPEEITAAGASACDTTALSPGTPDADGAFTITVTYDVPAEGMCVAAGDAASSEAAYACITVGAAAADDGGTDQATAADDEATDDSADGDVANTQEDQGADAAEGEDGELADTGAESVLLTIVAVAVIAAGAMFFGTTRRLGRS